MSPLPVFSHLTYDISLQVLPQMKNGGFVRRHRPKASAGAKDPGIPPPLCGPRWYTTACATSEMWRGCLFPRQFMSLRTLPIAYESNRDQMFIISLVAREPHNMDVWEALFRK